MIAQVCLVLAAVVAVQSSGLIGIGLGHLGGISAQNSVIKHVVPVGVVGLGHGIAAGPLGLGMGYPGYGHGLAAGNVRADGLIGHGIVGSRYGGVIAHNAVIGHGIVGPHYGGLVGLGHGIGLGYGLGKAVL